MPAPLHPASRRSRVFLACCVVAWLAAVAVPPVAFLRYRAARLPEISSPAALEEWERFRRDMRAQSDRSGPVQRKVPRSAEPPELVWLRDYPAVAVTAWVVFVGLLGGVTTGMLRGAVATRTAAAARVSDRGSAAP